MNFVLDNVLDGGVNDALNLDSHGKALAFWLLDMPIVVPRPLMRLLRGVSGVPGGTDFQLGPATAIPAQQID